MKILKIVVISLFCLPAPAAISSEENNNLRITTNEYRVTITNKYSDGTSEAIEKTKKVGRTNAFYIKIGSDNYKKLESYTLNIIQKTQYDNLKCIIYHSEFKKLFIRLSEKDDCSPTMNITQERKDSDLINKHLLSWAKNSLIDALDFYQKN
ncbi:MAG: hypothetical protein VBE63_17570 [Lamprobacter sp.]|uniref:hypothetical protein n=1 Tax=Lamprobacter sp. TaxID=3100796 RepID=UPI002B25D521|nr:hypothetical protein [Lamprobacter sp.]MEA3641727.1 hypothetical protein [Lamprobacter sp.]